MATKANHADARLKSCEVYVLFLEKKVDERDNQFVGKDTTATGHQQRVVALEKEVASLPVDMKRYRVQNEAGKGLLPGVCTGFVLHKTAS